MSRPYDKLMKDAECHRYALAEDIYQLGRADKDKELSELPNQYSEKLWKIAHDRGYEQGRADQKEEDNAFFNFEGAWELEKKKVRADAIDECKKIVMAECTTTCDYPFFPNCIECMTNKMEQLKEQNQ